MKQINQTIWRLGIAIVLIQLFDIIIHVATNQVEPIRIAASVIISAWIGLVFWNKLGKSFAVISQAAMTIYIILNVIFINTAGVTNPTNDSPRLTLFAIVTLTTILATWLYTICKREIDQAGSST